jgi:hypothetical protein
MAAQRTREARTTRLRGGGCSPSRPQDIDAEGRLRQGTAAGQQRQQQIASAQYKTPSALLAALVSDVLLLRASWVLKRAGYGV